MSSSNRVLGFDTSAYTASVALLDGMTLVREARRVVPVPAGRRGVRPGDALFHHVTKLADLLAEVWHGEALSAVAVSARPRPVADSYLPPFRAGVLVARAVAQARGIPCFETTHQEGHVAAGRWDAKGPADDWFWALHISGGTTELFRVERRQAGRYRMTTVGATADLYAGQLVDRVGVRLGLSFPAGPALERLSATAEDRLVLPVGAPFVRDGLWRISFSGPEAAAMRAVDLGTDPAAVARGVEEAIARGLVKLVQRATAGEPGPLLVVGGVAANLRLRRLLTRALAPPFGLWFASPEFSRDNAVGVAVIGQERLEAGQEE
jgi:N6-L-threonylcarbamoyladenine synthase